MKKLSLIGLITLVAGNCIGSGIFLLPSSLAKFGNVSLLSWVVTAIGAIFLALVFAKLAKEVGGQGGPYAFCKNQFGDFWGFATAYNYWIGMWIGSASVAVATTSYLSTLIPFLANSSIAKLICSILIIWLMTLINLKGVSTAGLVQIILTFLKISPLIFLVIVGFVKFNPTNFSTISAYPSFFKAILGGSALTLWSFIGLESACVPANEVANPKKNIPLATILGTLITAFIYITSSIAIFSLLPLDVLVNSTAPFSDAAYQVFGHFGYITMTLVAVISSIGSLNGWIMLQGQVPLAMANDNLLPKFFKKINKDSPINSILVSSTLTTLILLFSYSDSFIKTFEFLIEIAVFSTLIVYIITCFAYINKYKRLDFISFVATFYAIGMLLSIGMLENIWGFCLSLTAIPMFYLMKKTSN